MERYLISIKSENGNKLYTSISGDSFRSFAVGSFDAHNLWNYSTPWTAARRLEQIAENWENRGFTVCREYGTILDMPKYGNKFNCDMVIADFT